MVSQEGIPISTRSFGPKDMETCRKALNPMLAIEGGPFGCREAVIDVPDVASKTEIEVEGRP
jgi:hypothetical protein